MMSHRCMPAALAAMTLLVACGSVATAPSTATARPSPAATRAVLSIPTPTPTVDPSTDPATAIRAAVTAGDPRLLPTYLPSGMSSRVSVSPTSYEVSYTDSLHTRELYLGVNSGVNPPLMGGSSGSQSRRQFRGVQTSYAIYDTTAPLSQRYLWWQEPGTWSPPSGGRPGVEYFLSASGLTEAEFFRVADSLQPVR